MDTPDKIALAVGWLIATSILFATAGAFDSPAIMPDELCFLGWHRFLSGGEFYSMGWASYCHPMYPGLLAGLQWFVNTPEEAYRAALLLNCAMAGACLPLAAIIAMQHLELSRLQSWATALLTSLYPAMVAYTRYAWPEALLYLLALAWLLAWCRLVERPSDRRAWTWLAVSITAYFAHPRMLALPIIVVIVSLLWWLRDRKASDRLRFLAAVGATVAAIGLMSHAKAWSTPTDLTFGSVVPLDKLEFTSIAMISGLMARVGGQLCFALIATAGIAWFPLAWSASAALHTDKNPKFLLKIAAAPAMLLALTTISALFLARSERFDTYFYGRYAGPAILASIVAAMGVLGQRENRGWMTWMLPLAVACLLLFELAAPSNPGVDYSNIHVTGARPIFDWLKPRMGTMVFHWIIVGLVLAVALGSALAARLGWGLSALLAATLFITMHATGESRRTGTMDAHLPGGELAQVLGRENCRVLWDTGIAGRRQNHQAYRLQYAYPACQFKFATGDERCELLEPGTILVMESHRQYPCTQPPLRKYPLQPDLDAYMTSPSAGRVPPRRDPDSAEDDRTHR